MPLFTNSQRARPDSDLRYPMNGAVGRVALIAAATLALLLLGTGAHAKGNTAAQHVTVERVLDGDTVAVRGWEQHVRLASVDAPEMSHGYGKPGQPFSVAAQHWLSAQLLGAPDVTISCVDEDRYRRPVCNFYRGSVHINRELIAVGLAWANTANKRYLRDASLIQVQQEARERRRGVWSQGDPIEPWKWRDDCWKQKQCALPSGARHD